MGYNFVDRGRVGLERSYDDDLTGKADEFQTIFDQLRGKQREGDDVVTTLDPRAQQTAVEGLAGRAGSVVAIEPETGAVRVMTSVPTFNANSVPGATIGICTDATVRPGTTSAPGVHPPRQLAA